MTRCFRRAKREDGPSCPLTVAAFRRRFSCVIPIQFYGLWEIAVQLFLCILVRITWQKTISTGASKSHIVACFYFSFQTALWAHLFEGVSCNGLERQIHIYGFFGAGLKVGHVVLTLTPGLSLFGAHLCAWGQRSVRDQSIHWFKIY